MVLVSRHQETVQYIAILLAFAALSFSVFSAWQSAQAVDTLKTQLAVPTPLPLPQVKAIKLISVVCAECWTPDAVLASLSSKASVALETINAQTPEGQKLITQYNITRAPTLIATGQIEDARLAAVFSQGWQRRQDAFVFTAQEPVYFNPQTYEVTGRVSLVRVVEPKCTSCVDLSSLSATLTQAKVSISSERQVNASSAEGAVLMKAYGIKTLPFLVLSKDVSAYAKIVQAWKEVGTIESDGAFVWRKAVPPFFNLTTNMTEGLVNLTELSDVSCTQCYDVRVHESILANFGLVFDNVSRLDVRSPQGRSLVDKYAITRVPTVLLSSNARLYDAVVQVWPKIGSQEKDGTFVFRNIEALGNATATNVTLGAPGGVNATGNAFLPSNNTAPASNNS